MNIEDGLVSTCRHAGLDAVEANGWSGRVRIAGLDWRWKKLRG